MNERATFTVSGPVKDALAEEVRRQVDPIVLDLAKLAPLISAALTDLGIALAQSKIDLLRETEARMTIEARLAAIEAIALPLTDLSRAVAPLHAVPQPLAADGTSSSLVQIDAA